jgi:hypothetical protein
MNLAIALVEEKPTAVRSITRGLPLEELRDLTKGHVIGRFEMAVEQRCKRAVHNKLKEMLRVSMAVGPPEERTPAETQAFFEGLKVLEDMIDYDVRELEQELNLEAAQAAFDAAKPGRDIE